MKAYITKYALTEGILLRDVEITEGGFAMFKIRDNDWYNFLAPKSHYYETKQDAIDKSNAMKAKKIKSLESQIAKLKTLKFD